MKRGVLLFFVLGLYIASNANNICLNVKGTIKFERSAINDATIEVIKSGSIDTVVFSDNSGKFRLDLEKNQEYKVVIKKEGFFSPSIIVNTAIKDDDDYCWNYKIAVNLIPKIDIENSTIFDKPIGHIAYNEYSDEFENEVNSDIIAKYREFIARYESTKKSIYKDMVTKADSAFMNEDCRTALDLYVQAAQINTYDTYADNQAELIRNFRLKYMKNIEEADSYYHKKDYQKAKALYLRALEIKQQDYPMAQIKKLEELISGENCLAAQ